jgi:hypothetical protein
MNCKEKRDGATRKMKPTTNIYLFLSKSESMDNQKPFRGGHPTYL